MSLCLLQHLQVIGYTSTIQYNFVQFMFILFGLRQHTINQLKARMKNVYHRFRLRRELFLHDVSLNIGHVTEMAGNGIHTGL